MSASLQFGRNMAVATYLLKTTKRIGFFVLIVILTALAIHSIRDDNVNDENYFSTLDTTTEMYESNKKNGIFILLWTDPDASPFNYFGKGSYVFRAKSCKYTNCYVSGNREELGDVSLFDVVMFNGPQLTQMLKLKDFPKSRSSNQKYVYANVESAQNYPLCHFNGFFNWTWTYRLDSDVNWGYFAVKNRTGHVVAPSINVVWENMDTEDVDEKLKMVLKSKSKAVAWFATNCRTKSHREDYVEIVKGHLKNYSLNVDVYGACGTLQCPSFINERCLHLLEKEYYFYFAFENSFDEDYVTEKILSAYRHNTVPIVYGGANYSRFLPPGSYLNAYDLGPEKLAQTINYLIKNPDMYYKYFRWQKYYSFHYLHESPDTDDYCKFCEVLNGNGLLKRTVHWNIKDWWNGLPKWFSNNDRSVYTVNSNNPKDSNCTFLVTFKD